MTGKIPNLFINDLLERTDIVNIINERIELKKQGNNFIASCPFHNEKTPSFTVNKEKQFFHCFGCGAHGNAIDFIMNYYKFNFIESIEDLATRYSLEVPYENKKEYNKKYNINKIYKIMEKISLFYHKILFEKSSIQAYKYLKKRGLNDEIIKKFNIGFAPNYLDTLNKKFNYLEDNSINKTGMLIVNNINGKTYDRFRKRIMFPIHDKFGRVIGFGGRTIDTESSKNNKPKYINSPETEIFNKGNNLYGLYEANKNNNELSKILIVEGYMDVLALSQFGINYAVASLGTSTTYKHIQLMYRITDKIICCYDGDYAGRKAAWRTLLNSLNYLTDGRQLLFMFLPNGYDPDKLIRKIGKEAFEQYIKYAQPLSKFFFYILMQKVDLSSIDGRAKLSTLALPLIKKVAGETLRIYLYKQLGNKLGIIDDIKLEKIINKYSKKINIYSKLPNLKNSTMRTLIGLIVQNPKLATLVPTTHELEQSNKPGIMLFIKIVNTCKEKKLNTGQLLEIYRNDKLYPQLETLATWNNMIKKNIIVKMFTDTLVSLYKSILEQRQEKLIAIDRKNGINIKERKELWSINIALAKKYK